MVLWLELTLVELKAHYLFLPIYLITEHYSIDQSYSLQMSSFGIQLSKYLLEVLWLECLLEEQETEKINHVCCNDILK